MSAEVIEMAPDRMPEPDRQFRPAPARSVRAALDELCGAYTESRLEQIAYPQTLSANGWRMALRYAIVVVGGEKGMKRLQEIHEAYPLPRNLQEF